MSILNVNDLALQLVALDFSDGHMPNNGGPTKTSRALAIIHLAAHDAYALVSGGSLNPMLAATKIPNLPATLVKNAANGSAAMLCAGVRAASVLYPDFKKFIAAEAAKFSSSNEDGCCNDLACKYGEQVADAWIASRMNDGSSAPQLDTLYNQAAGHHRPDPLDPKQQTLGRNWGLVTPFVLDSVVADAFLGEAPLLTSPKYATAFEEVVTGGKNSLPQTNPDNAVIGIFWGYDGANKIGVPPRLYNQVVRAIEGFSMQPHELQLKVLTAINVAMADAGIAAWYWKYRYDVWRPVVGIREADAGWGPMGKGNDNPLTKGKGDPFWLPLGAPSSNSLKPNGTPGFPAYPSGHATFGGACFETAAALLGSTPAETNVEFVSDEFNGITTDNTGVVRPKYTKKFDLATAIKDNNESRIWLGVHWRFDADGGEKVGSAIASKVVMKFKST
jgi:hypothetical protein